MQPRRERRLTAKLADLHAELRKRVLGGIACVLGVSKHMGGQLADAGGVSCAQRLEGVRVSVVGASHEDRVTEPVVRKLGFRPQRGADSAAWA